MKRKYKTSGFRVEVGLDTAPRNRDPILSGIVRGRYHDMPESDLEVWVSICLWRFRLVFVQEYMYTETDTDGK